MGIRDRLTLRGRLHRYEKITVVGILLTALGSSMAWLTVEATPDAASRLDDVEAGTTVFTGLEVNWGEITLYLAIFVAILLVLVLWRYHGPGRMTGLLIMLVGLIAAGVAVVGMVLTGLIFAPAGEIEGITVDVGLGIFVTLLGALLLLSGGILRLAAGPAAAGESDAAD